MKKEFLDKAIYYAKKAYDIDEVPIGAVIVKDNEIIGYGYNKKEKEKSVLEHAEISAIKMAEKKVDNWRLNGCDIYVSLDPCPMCASAIKQARIKNVYSALNNLDNNNFEIISQIFRKDKVNPEVKFITNLDIESSKKILNSFFKKQRNK
ncbi:MAG: nucleoside deaminase [Bacilli bacterium]|nr:nucleoside deaminase [Bacilli bacterium]